MYSKNKLALLGFFLALLLAAAAQGNSITGFTYEYSIAPSNESAGPHAYGAGLLSDGTPENPDGGTAKWTSGQNIRESAITFDLQKDYPLDKVELVSKCDNEWWGIRFIKIRYRSADGQYSEQQEIEWYGTQLPLQIPERRFVMTIPLDNQIARYVEIVVRNLHSGQNMPLTEVKFYEGFDPLIRTGQYSYTTPPQEEGAGPHPFGEGILTDGTTGDPLGRRATWPAAMQIRQTKITFDLLQDHPLAKIKLISTLPNEWWGIRQVTVAYRSENGSLIVEPTIQWYGQKLPLDVPERRFDLEIPMHNQLIRYVEITIRNLHEGQNMPLTEVQFFRAVPDGQASTIAATPLQALADGESVITVEVAVRDKENNPLANEKVILNKSDGSLPFEPVVAFTNSAGIATFSLASVHSGAAELAASVDTGMGMVTLAQKVNVEFLQAASKDNSELSLADGQFSADGETIRTVKVVVKDYAGAPINGRTVTLASDNGKIVIVGSAAQISGPTAENPDFQAGEAVFRLKAEASDAPIEGTLTATISPAAPGEGETTLAKTVRFEPRIKNVAVEVKRELAIGLAEPDVPAGKVPTDGVSKWVVTVDIGQENRIVSLEEKVGEGETARLSPGDIQPAAVVTGSAGRAVFAVSTVNGISAVELVVSVANDVAAKTIQLGFEPADLGLYVIATTPAHNTQDAEVTEPIEVAFNKEIFPDADAVLTLVSETGQILSDVYTNGNATVSGNVLTWQLPRLNLNVFYTATIEGVKDSAGNAMKKYSWQFRGNDTTPPAVEVRDGLLAVEPKPWAVEVQLAPTLRVKFTEELRTDEAGRPVGLQLVVVDEDGVALPGDKLQFVVYDAENHVVEFALVDLKEGSTYTVTVAGAVDYADLEMQPVSWTFSTRATQLTLKVISLETAVDAKGDVRTDSSLKVYFNKQLRSEPAPRIIVIDEQGETVSGSTTFVNGLDGVALMFAPAQHFSYDTVYQVAFENVADLQGNPLQATELSFLTEVASDGPKTIVPEQNVYTFVLPLLHGANVTVAVEVPQESVRENARLTVSNVHRREKEYFAGRLFNPRLGLTASIFEFTAAGLVQTDGRFPAPLKITLPYVAQDGLVATLDNRYVPVHSLRVFRWEPQTGEWLPVGGVVDEDTGTVSCYVEEFSIYGLVGSVAEPEGSFLSEVALTANPISPLAAGARGQTTLKFYLHEPAVITLKVFDANGRLVGTLLDGEEFLPGDNGIVWDGRIAGRTLPRGLYVIQLYAVNNNRTAFYNQVIGVW